MENGAPEKTPRRRRTRRTYACSLCGGGAGFCWSCPCGFQICSACMEENLWGMTCNAIVWTCPDCGAIRGFGNQ